MRPTHLPLLATFVLATGCGGGDEAARADVDFDTAAVADAPVAEDPGLPIERSSFEPRDVPGAEGVEGELWLTGTGRPQEDGISFVAQLRGVPVRAYGWAIHRGGCDQPDDVLLPLGWGTEANRDRSRSGGALGEVRPAFEPSLEGEVAQTVFVPLGGDLSRERLRAEPHSVRIHPDPGDERINPSVACAPVPPLQDAGGA